MATVKHLNSGYFAIQGWSHMTEPLVTRRYTIDFFQLTHVSTPEVPTIEDGFNIILEEEVEPILVSNGYMRDLWTLALRSRPKSYAGQFR